MRIAPRDLTNVRSIGSFVLANDPHVYGYIETLYRSQLYTVDGLR